ncbi:methyltransferase [Saccharothrix variisporea]|uniref:Methyltransferase family protein n=1 Tax=Saccharothrix variisporea TaxID=543527 RepID=A0A495XJZ9_9PSEU|nr:methyltransferase [Saccharothrix variisporea]RKT74861.1 methyltransferase family protein [Saccharothrix variisporea]
MAAPTDIAARRTVLNLVFGSMSAQVVAACVKLGVADALDGGERTVEQVAGACGTPTDTTHRLLRAATAIGLAVEPGPGRFAVTEAGALLRSTGAGSLSAFARVFTDPVMLTAWHRLDEAVRTGRTTFEQAFGVEFFDHLKTEPELAAAFNAAMSQGTHVAAAVLPGAYDFGRFTTVADVGGGDGTLLAAILGRHENLRGVLFDTAEGSAQAADVLATAGLADRCEIRAGDFFESAPGGVDAMVLKSVLHDWDDERATTILRNCREALPDGGRLLVVEPVLPEAVADAVTPVMYLSDLNMLVNLGGQERTREEFEALARGAGFAVADVVPLPPSGFCLVEAVAA